MNGGQAALMLLTWSAVHLPGLLLLVIASGYAVSKSKRGAIVVILLGILILDCLALGIGDELGNARRDWRANVDSSLFYVTPLAVAAVPFAFATRVQGFPARRVLFAFVLGVVSTPVAMLVYVLFHKIPGMYQILSTAP